MVTPRSRRDRRRRGADLQAGGVRHGTGQDCGVAGAVGDGRAVGRLTRSDRQRRGVLPGRHRVAEGQRIGAGAADIGRGAAVVERQRRRARNRHSRAHVQRQGNHLARASLPVEGEAATDVTLGGATKTAYPEPGKSDIDLTVDVWIAGNGLDVIEIAVRICTDLGPRLSVVVRLPDAVDIVD